jgi:hypothetical protein
MSLAAMTQLPLCGAQATGRREAAPSGVVCDLQAVLGDYFVLGLVEDVVLLADLGEGGNRFADVLGLVSGRELSADAGEALAHHREEEPDDVGAFGFLGTSPRGDAPAFD